MTRGPRTSGFVLIEALVTLALSALIIVGIGSLVALMLRSADRSALALEELETGGRAVAALERDISAAARVYRMEDEQPAMVFLGEPDRLFIVLDRPSRDGSIEQVLVRWQSEETTAGRGRLIRTEAPLLPGLPVPGEDVGQPVAVDTGPAVIRFAYFSPQTDGQGEILTDSWTIPQRMPTAVRIATTAPGDIEVRRSVRVPIRVDAEVACLNPAFGYCSLTGARRQTDDGATTPGPQTPGGGQPGERRGSPGNGGRPNDG